LTKFGKFDFDRKFAIRSKKDAANVAAALKRRTGIVIDKKQPISQIKTLIQNEIEREIEREIQFNMPEDIFSMMYGPSIIRSQNLFNILSQRHGRAFIAQFPNFELLHQYLVNKYGRGILNDIGAVGDQPAQ
jgi:hypothetical protein